MMIFLSLFFLFLTIAFGAAGSGLAIICYQVLTDSESDIVLKLVCVAGGALAMISYMIAFFFLVVTGAAILN